MVEDKKPPIGVKILSVLNYISFGSLILLGILFIILGIFAKSILQEYSSFGNIATVLAVVISIILIALGILYFFIARGLWRGRNWARIVVIVLSLISFLASLISIVTGDFTALFGLIISSIIAGYLLLNEKVKEFFA